jgi:thiamine pyrophosphate-dependent acetolactate synthase large subunit-like protein
MLTKEQFLKPLAQHRGDAVVVTTMGTVRPWGGYSNSEFDFASADSAMGHAADLALGIALARPERKVICLNGDGSMLMSLGTLVTAAQSAAANFVLFVIQNNTYEITGNQPIPGAGLSNFKALAEAAGFPKTYAFSDAEDYARQLPALLSQDAGPIFAVVSVEPGNEGPLSRGPEAPTPYLKCSLAESAQRLRETLRLPGTPREK